MHGKFHLHVRKGAGIDLITTKLQRADWDSPKAFVARRMMPSSPDPRCLRSGTARLSVQQTCITMSLHMIRCTMQSVHRYR